MTETWWQDENYHVTYYRRNAEVSTLTYTGLRLNSGRTLVIMRPQQDAALELLRSGTPPSAVLYNSAVMAGIRILTN